MTLLQAKVIARVMLALVWLVEGLVPKILFQTARELEWIEAVPLWIVSPAWTLAAIGVFEIAVGLWLLSGLAERAAVAFATVVGVGLGVIVAVIDPATLIDPLGGVVKDFGLIGCAAAVWALHPVTGSMSG